ncbi:DsbA family oxidoreductase [Metabacillus fastidiosus]|uniref:DsbA family oxidoreductase n=1 Tax=Metabacillus fastidiosus TaxID=1458 RepID=UPI002DB71F15|nr:DsbA family oxidoreductase [Metabacillus fastidiosus]MEC2074881.1 DsbA family oxidoreductase [Metabacillus fastidiosus]
MKIEVWSDFACPFCYIGKRRLEEALMNFPHKNEVDILFKSFELDPNASRDIQLSIHEILAKKYGMSIEKAKAMNASVGQQAAAAGLTFEFDNMKPTNTFDAHRLAKLAESKGKGKEMTEQLLKAYFTDSEHIGNHDTLLKIAEEVGLNREEAKSVLESDDFAEHVRADEMEAREIGVQGVPFFVINRKYAISGAQPVEVFGDTLQKVWEEENKKISLEQIKGNEAGVCTEDGCELPEK